MGVMVVTRAMPSLLLGRKERLCHSCNIKEGRVAMGNNSAAIMGIRFPNPSRAICPRNLRCTSLCNSTGTDTCEVRSIMLRIVNDDGYQELDSNRKMLLRKEMKYTFDPTCTEHSIDLKAFAPPCSSMYFCKRKQSQTGVNCAELS